MSVSIPIRRQFMLCRKCLVRFFNSHSTERCVPSVNRDRLLYTHSCGYTITAKRKKHLVLTQVVKLHLSDLKLSSRVLCLESFGVLRNSCFQRAKEPCFNTTILDALVTSHLETNFRYFPLLYRIFSTDKVAS